MPEDNISNGKTEEILAKERAERFAKDPNSFVEIKELICAVMKNDNSGLGVSILVNECKRSTLDVCQVELVHRFDLLRRQMDVMAQMKKVVPGNGNGKHGMIDFVRRGFK
jgi:hypothetical protein